MTIRLDGKIRTRQQAVVRLLSIASLVGILLFASISLYFLSHAPSLGVCVEWNDAQKHWSVTSAAPENPLRTGDIILRIGDIRVGQAELLPDSGSPNADLDFHSWIRAKRSIYEALNKPLVVIQVDRRGKEMAIGLRPAKAGLSFLGKYSVIHILLLSLSFFWIGILVWNRAQRTSQNLVFFLMTMSYSLLLMTLAFSSNTITAEPVFYKFLHIFNFVFFLLSAAFALHFSFLFPRPRKFIDRHPAALWGYYGINALVLVVFDTSFIDRLTAGYYILAFSSFVYVLCAYRKPIERQQMKWVIAGFLFCIGPWLGINGIPLLLTGDYLLPDFIAGSLIICIPLFVAFAIHKYRLFDIDALFEGTFVYGLTIAMLGLVDFGFLSLLGSKIESRYWLGTLGKDLLSIIVVVVLYAPLRHESRKLIKRLFRRDRIEEGAIIRSFIQSASGQSPERIVEVFADSVQATFPAKVRRLLGKGDAADLDLFAHLQIQDEPVRLWERDLDTGLDLQDMYLALPLRRQESVEYVLLLGELSTGRFYSRKDLTILKSLLIQARLLYENAHLYQENLRQAQALVLEEKRSSRERERILKDLHDGLGGTTTNISFLAEMGKNLTSPADIQKTFSTISELSAESLSEIRSFLHSMDDSKISWDALAADLRHFGNRMLESHDISFDMDCSLNGSDHYPDRYLCLIIFRVYKETLANILKHSHATSVRVVFRIETGKLLFSISDNGVGIRNGDGKGRGLRNIRKRTEEISGQLSIHSGEGTRIELIVPLPIKYPDETLELNGQMR
ncbi:MAG: hypothetical protein JXA73_12615 [Acidobacteria bacterium]|nr:hypothetical protein [Acidobacteriota bacterium]